MLGSSLFILRHIDGVMEMFLVLVSAMVPKTKTNGVEVVQYVSNLITKVFEQASISEFQVLLWSKYSKHTDFYGPKCAFVLDHRWRSLLDS